MDALNLNRGQAIGRVPFFGNNPGYRQFTSDLFPGSGGDKFSNACCGSNFSNLSGTLLAEWEECKTKDSQIAAWDMYDSQLAKWNADKDAACGAVPTKPTAPTLQTLIKTPVDACDEEANKKASDYNALVTNRYQTLLKAYNDAVANCTAVTNLKPSPPSYPRPTGTGTDALTSFTGFSNANGKSYKNINGCGCNYTNANGEVVTTGAGGFKPDLSGLLAMAVVGALVWYVVNGKKIKF